jgi:hypothetical protein
VGDVLASVLQQAGLTDRVAQAAVKRSVLLSIARIGPFLVAHTWPVNQCTLTGIPARRAANIPSSPALGVTVMTASNRRCR